MSSLARRSAVGACLLAVSLIQSTILGAQDTAPPEKGRIGLGVALTNTTVFIDDFGLLTLDVNSLTVPIRTAGGTMIEPEIGFVRFSNSGGGFESSFSTLRLGTGVLFPLRARDAFHPYVGPRIAIVRSVQSTSSSFSGKTTETNTGWQFGLALGGQYWLNDHVTIGGEGLLSRLGFGEPDIDPAPPGGSSDSSNSFITLSGTAFLRLFF